MNSCLLNSIIYASVSITNPAEVYILV